MGLRFSAVAVRLVSALVSKIWTRPIVEDEAPETPTGFYVNLHLVHEVASPQAFAALRVSCTEVAS